MKMHLVHTPEPKHFCLVALAGVLLLPTGSALAQTDTAQALAAAKTQGDTKNRIGLSYRFPIGFTADFKDVGGFTAMGTYVNGVGNQPGNPGSSSTAPQNRTYENGYVWVDQTGNAGGQTWFWGYNNVDAQAIPDPSAPVAIAMQSSASAEVSINDRKDEMVPGFELNYTRELIRKEKYRAGFELAFGYNDLEIDTGRPMTSDVNRINDSFALSGLDFGQPLPPSYQGTYEGPTVPGQPGRLVIAQPQRATVVIPDGAQIYGSRSICADLFSFRVGPYLELPFSKKVSLTLGGGLAATFVHSTFKFSESITIPGVGTQENIGSDTDSGWVVGGYLSAIFSAEFHKDWRFFGGVNYQFVGDYIQKAGGKKVVLEMGESIFISAGVSYSF
jgi:hypothetical protein